MAMTLDELAAAGLVDPSWAQALAPVAPDIAALGERLRAEVAAGTLDLLMGEGSSITQAAALPHRAHVLVTPRLVVR